MLSRILNPITDASHHKLKNSAHLRNELNSLTIDDNDVLVSFDVKSLFTQISQDFALNCLEKALNNSEVWKTRTLLEKEDILELGKLCLSSTVFTYQDVLYK